MMIIRIVEERTAPSDLEARWSNGKRRKCSKCRCSDGMHVEENEEQRPRVAGMRLDTITDLPACILPIQGGSQLLHRGGTYGVYIHGVPC
ncbi:hypothetical protein JTB14_016099 [Gonioctena quinquepunctata]|nr:hypothetical protein JTB14_016099 [Gonioctena quinquepunctata]